MKAFEEITSNITALRLSNVDTDMILPAEFLTSISREGYGANLFRRLRDEDDHFPLHDTRYADSKILLADENFGCGSSREHAVWALLGHGFRVIIAKSFADIFASNSGKNGLLLISLPSGQIEALFQGAQDPAWHIQISLEKQEIALPDGQILHFPYDPFQKHCLLHGLDDLDYILAEQEKIKKYFAEHPL